MTDDLDRRRFFYVGAGAAIASNITVAAPPALPRSAVAANDDRVVEPLQAQATDTDQLFFGGIPDSREL